jgi:hypothetical protein
VNHPFHETLLVRSKHNTFLRLRDCRLFEKRVLGVLEIVGFPTGSDGGLESAAQIAPQLCPPASPRAFPPKLLVARKIEVRMPMSVNRRISRFPPGNLLKNYAARKAGIDSMMASTGSQHKFRPTEAIFAARGGHCKAGLGLALRATVAGCKLWHRLAGWWILWALMASGAACGGPGCGSLVACGPAPRVRLQAEALTFLACGPAQARAGVEKAICLSQLQ